MLSISPCKWISLVPQAKSLKPWHFLLAAAAPAASGAVWEREARGALTPISRGSWVGGVHPHGLIHSADVWQLLWVNRGKITHCPGRWDGLGFGDPSGSLPARNMLRFWGGRRWELQGVERRNMSRTVVTGGPQRGPGAWTGGGITVKDNLSWR